jgi:hypothetical protein
MSHSWTLMQTPFLPAATTPQPAQAQPDAASTEISPEERRETDNKEKEILQRLPPLALTK